MLFDRVRGETGSFHLTSSMCQVWQDKNADGVMAPTATRVSLMSLTYAYGDHDDKVCSTNCLSYFRHGCSGLQREPLEQTQRS